MKLFEKIISGLKKILGNDVFYVNGSDTLPPPLSRQEEEIVFAGLVEKIPKRAKN